MRPTAAEIKRAMKRFKAMDDPSAVLRLRMALAFTEGRGISLSADDLRLVMKDGAMWDHVDALFMELVELAELRDGTP